MGNNDSHAKNLSIYKRPGEGVRLTPSYDLMCTRIYPGLSAEFAFNVGGAVHPGNIGKVQAQALARQVDMGARYLQSLALVLAAKLPYAIDRAVAQISPDLIKGRKTFADKLVMKVKSTTKRTTVRIDS